MGNTKMSDAPLKALNATGYPLQMALRHEIERTSGQHGFVVLGEEFRWSHPDKSSAAGFADLVLGSINDDLRLVIECKRPSGGEWVFARRRADTPASQRRLSCFFCDRDGGDEVWGWCDEFFEPSSPESGFCAVQGQDREGPPMLERVADFLLPATEAIARDELNLRSHSEVPDCSRLFIPVIVTTAELWVSSINPSDVNLESGKLPSGKDNSTPVHLVRFRKSLGTIGDHASRLPEDVHDAWLMRQVSVLVVSASHLVEALLVPLRAPRSQRTATMGHRDHIRLLRNRRTSKI